MKENVKDLKNFGARRDEMMQYIKQRMTPLEELLHEILVKLDQFMKREIELFDKANLYRTTMSRLER